MFSSSTSFAGWKKVITNENGTTYVDFERIKKHGGYVYFWFLNDWLKPNKYGDLSQKGYTQGDCKIFRYKGLSGSGYKGPMGGGTVVFNNKLDKEWKYPQPDSPPETILKTVCQYAR